jgi:hypothetical protein
MELQRLQRDIALLESELNHFKREKEIVDQEYNRRKNQLLELSRMATTSERHTELIRQMVELGSRWRQAVFNLNDKIYVRTQELNCKKRQL